MIQPILNFAGVIAAAVLIAEIYFAAQWNTKWLKTGLIVFRWKVKLRAFGKFGVQSTKLERASQSIVLGKMVFKSIDPTTIVFREAMLTFRLFCYSPVMHGIIHIDYENKNAVVEGRLYWFMLPFLAVCGLLLLPSISQDFVGMAKTIGFLIGILYSIQLYRYARVAGELQE